MTRLVAIALALAAAATAATPAHAQGPTEPAPASGPGPLAPRLRVMIPGCRPADFDPDAFLAALQVELASRMLTIDLTTPEEAWERDENGPQAAAALVLKFPSCETTRALLVLRDRARRQVHRRAMELHELAPPLRPRALALSVAELLRLPPRDRPSPAMRSAPAASAPHPARAAGAEGPPPRAEVARPPRWWLGVGLGAGVGLARGSSECAWNEGPQPDGRNYSGSCVHGGAAKTTPVRGGLTTAPLHLAPEAGFHAGARWAVSIQGRIQVLTLADEGAHDWAAAVLGRASCFFGSPRLRYYVVAGLGGGYLRHRVPLGAIATMADDPAIRERSIVDTVRAGPVLFSVGGGLRYQVSSHLGLQGEVSFLAAAPEATAHADLNLGVYLGF
ncbi:MAG: hypothetical protein HY906_04555 [Deltaproteobacteria bacterium]|nr:hypothetical protein [Deltaproteobacteria bacterium]